MRRVALTIDHIDTVFNVSNVDVARSEDLLILVSMTRMSTRPTPDLVSTRGARRSRELSFSLSRTLPAFSHEFQTQVYSHRLVAAAWDSSSLGPAERSGSVVGLQTSERVSRRFRSRVALLYVCTHASTRPSPRRFAIDREIRLWNLT